MYRQSFFIIQRLKQILKSPRSQENLAWVVREVCQSFHQVYIYQAEIAINQAEHTKTLQDYQHRQDVYPQRRRLCRRADPGCSWLPETLARDALGYIKTGIDALQSGLWPLKDREPCPLETTIPGVLAAGDIRSGSPKRVGFAVGDGAMAVTCVNKLIAIRN